MSDGPWDPTKEGKTQEQPVIPTISENNVVAINAKKRERKKTGTTPGAVDGEKKRAPAEIYADISAMIRRSGSAPNLAPFPEHFITVTSDGGATKALVEVLEGDICRPVRLQRVVDKIIWYCGKIIIGTPGYRLDHKQATECAKYWLAESQPLAPPAPFLFADEKGLCYRRIPFVPRPGPMSHCQKVLARMSGPIPAGAHIGSLFDPGSYQQQYLYIHGDGGDGKGALMRLLGRIFGPSATSVSSPPMRSNKHWAVDYVDRRVVILSDLTEARAMQGAALRSITGGDPITVDPKGSPSYCAKLACKLIVCSNTMLELENNNADKRRPIYVSMKPRDAADSDEVDFEEELWKEAPAFVHWCMEQYYARAQGGGAVKLLPEERRAVNDWAAISDDVYEMFWRDEFVVDPGASVLASDVARRLIGRKVNVKDWYAWLRRTHPELAGSAVVRVGKSLARVYWGWRIKLPLQDDNRDDVPVG